MTVKNTLKAIEVLKLYGVLDKDDNPIYDEYGIARLSNNKLISEVAREYSIPHSAIKDVLAFKEINFSHNRKDFIIRKSPSSSRIATLEKYVAHLTIMLYQSNYKDFSRGMDSTNTNLRNWAFNIIRNQPKQKDIKLVEDNNVKEEYTS